MATFMLSSGDSVPADVSSLRLHWVGGGESQLTEGGTYWFDLSAAGYVGEKYGKTAAQIALQYLVQQGIGVIPKSSHRERMVENLDIFDVTLTPDDMARIQQLETGKTLFGWYEE